jgi:hypothetical protein
MSDQTKKLSPSDPVTQEDREKLNKLAEAQYDIALQVYELEQRKVQLLVAGRQVDGERSKLFEKILMDRGLPPNVAVEIDATSGLIKILRSGQPPAPMAQPPAPPSE